MKKLLFPIIIFTFLFACSENIYYNNSSTNVIEGSIYTAPIQFANVKIYKLLDGTEHYLGTAKCDRLGKFSFSTPEFGPYIVKYESGSGKILGSNNQFFFDNLDIYLQDTDSVINTFAFLATTSFQENPSALDFYTVYNRLIRTVILCANKAGYTGISRKSLESAEWTPQAEAALSCLAIAAGAQHEDQIHNFTWISNFKQIINEYSPEVIVGMTEYNQTQLDLIEQSVQNVLNNVNDMENTAYTIAELKVPSQNIESNNITGIYFFTEDPNFLAKGQYELSKNINTINVISNSSDKLKGELNIWVMGLSSANEIKIFERDNLEQHYAELEQQLKDGTFAYAYDTSSMLNKLQNAFYPRFSHFQQPFNISVEVTPNMEITIERSLYNINEFKMILNLPANINQSYKIIVSADFGNLVTIRDYLDLNVRNNFGNNIDYAKNGWNIQFQKQVNFSFDQSKKELAITNITGGVKSWILRARDESNKLLKLASGTSTSTKVDLSSLVKGKYRLFFSSYGNDIYNGEKIESYGANRPRGYYELTID